MALEALVRSWGIAGTERSLGLWCASCLGFSCVSPDGLSERCACVRPCPHVDLLWCILSPLTPLQTLPQLHFTSGTSPVKVVCLSLLCVGVAVLVVSLESVLVSLSSPPPSRETLGVLLICRFCSLLGALLRVLQQGLLASVTPPGFPGGQLSLQRHRSSSVIIQTFLEVTGCPGSSVVKYIYDAAIHPFQWMKPWPGREVIGWFPTFTGCFDS